MPPWNRFPNMSEAVMTSSGLAGLAKRGASGSVGMVVSMVACTVVLLVIANGIAEVEVCSYQKLSLLGQFAVLVVPPVQHDGGASRFRFEMRR